MQITENVLKVYDKDLTFHDFRVVEGNSHSNIIFDIVRPFEKQIDLQKIKDMLPLRSPTTALFISL